MRRNQFDDDDGDEYEADNDEFNVERDNDDDDNGDDDDRQFYYKPTFRKSTQETGEEALTRFCFLTKSHHSQPDHLILLTKIKHSSLRH